MKKKYVYIILLFAFLATGCAKSQNNPFPNTVDDMTVSKSAPESISESTLESIDEGTEDYYLTDITYYESVAINHLDELDMSHLSVEYYDNGLIKSTAETNSIYSSNKADPDYINIFETFEYYDNTKLREFNHFLDRSWIDYHTPAEIRILCDENGNFNSIQCGNNMSNYRFSGRITGPREYMIEVYDPSDVLYATIETSYDDMMRMTEKKTLSSISDSRTIIETELNSYGLPTHRRFEIDGHVDNTTIFYIYDSAGNPRFSVCQSDENGSMDFYSAFVFSI